MKHQDILKIMLPVYDLCIHEFVFIYFKISQDPLIKWKYLLVQGLLLHFEAYSGSGIEHLIRKMNASPL